LAQRQNCFFAVENIGNKPVPALLFGKQGFGPILREFPKLDLLLDVGHAVAAKNLDEMLSFAPRVKEMHLHWASEQVSASGLDDHRSFTELEQLEFLEKIPQAREIPLVFEHGNDVSEAEVFAEKRLVETKLG